MLDKEQPAPEANGDPEPVLEVPDDFPEGRFDTKAFSETPIGVRPLVDRQEDIPTEADAETQKEESPSADEQPDSD